MSGHYGDAGRLVIFGGVTIALTAFVFSFPGAFPGLGRCEQYPDGESLEVKDIRKTLAPET
jgi:hypothetical protein